MTEEYINRSKLIEEIRKAASRSMVGEIDEPYLDWKTVVSFIFDAPAEAVAPTAAHTWNFKKYVGEDYYFCSGCGTEYKLPDTWSTYDVGVYCKYCSSCGAKMEVKK